MSLKQGFAKLSVILLFLLMLLFPDKVFAGASDGLLLWFRTVLPTLLPFIILSNLLIQTRAIDWLVRLTGPLLRRILHVSDHGSFVVLAGFLCGYPMGAKTASDLLRIGDISYEEAGYLLSFCNNSSPIFIISYVVLQNLHDEAFLLPTLAILMLSPLLSSFLFRRFHFRTGRQRTGFTRAFDVNHPCKSSANLLDSCIMNGFEAITKIGGYIMLFSIFFSLAQLLPLSHSFFYFLLLPSLEITNGIALLCSASLPSDIAFLLCMACISFGGWCAVAQTHCMIAENGLSIRLYIIEKLVTMLITSFLSYLYLTCLH